MDNLNNKKIHESIPYSFISPDTYDPKFCELKYQIYRDKFILLRNEINDLEKRHKEDTDNLEAKLLAAMEKRMEELGSLLKDKIVVSDKNRQEDISAIATSNSKIKIEVEGNGDIGLLEEVREIKKDMRRYVIIFSVICTLLLGGDFLGLTFQDYIFKIFHISIETKQTDVKKNVPVTNVSKDPNNVKIK